jgi:hypothetical protein
MVPSYLVKIFSDWHQAASDPIIPLAEITILENAARVNVRRRNAQGLLIVSGKKHQVPLGLLAGIASIAIGFIIIMPIILIGSIFCRTECQACHLQCARRFDTAKPCAKLWPVGGW